MPDQLYCPSCVRRIEGSTCEQCGKVGFRSHLEVTGSDQLPVGSMRVDCMAEIVFEMTRTDLCRLPACLLDDWFNGFALAVGMLPTMTMKTVWVKQLTDRYEQFYPGGKQAMVTMLADRIVDQDEDYARWRDKVCQEPKS